MQPDEGSTYTLDDFTGSTTDQGGGQYEQYIGADAPEHDPFVDYPDGPLPKPFSTPYALEAGLSYTLAHNLDARRHIAWGCWPGTVVGWIGDAAHQASCSDHNPDSTGVVHAIDVMVVGSEAAAVVREALAHNSDLQYVIHNRVIWSVTVGWAARAYTGSNPHTDHVHISGRHGGAHGTGNTCTGYDTAAEGVTPTFAICSSAPTPPPKPPAPGPGTHRPGSRVLRRTTPDTTGDDVRFVQRFIGSPCGAADGDFGPHTESGVRWYQHMRGITVDGVVGPQTYGQMGVRWTG